MSRRTKRALTSLSVIAAGIAPALAFLVWQQPSGASAQSDEQRPARESGLHPGEGGAAQLAQMQPAPRDVTRNPEIAADRTGPEEAAADAPETSADATPRTVEIPEDAVAVSDDVGGARVANGTVKVQLDHAQVVRLPERTQTVIVGNPIIADVTVQRNGILVVTGKSYGSTNMIALDASGALLAESMISVEAATDSVVTVQRGLSRESYSCTPTCQPSLRLGDSPSHFDGVGSQATRRNELATSR